MPTELSNDHPPEWALFGATGVTDALVLEEARKRGHRPMLIGRYLAKLNPLAAPHRLPVARATLEDGAALASVIGGRRLLLNVAGPASVTGLPLIRAALAAGWIYHRLGFVRKQPSPSTPPS